MQLAPIRLHSYADYQHWSKEHRAELESHRAEELALFPATPQVFFVEGTCALCDSKAVFKSGFDYPCIEDGREVPNLRENLICRRCGLKSRLRGALHLLLQELNPSPDQRIYITEQLGAAYRG